MCTTWRSLETLFREATGTTVWQMLVEIRLVHAHGLLTDSRLSVKEIAARTGWSNQLYFSSAFRRRFGHSPSEVRHRMLPLALPDASEPAAADYQPFGIPQAIRQGNPQFSVGYKVGVSRKVTRSRIRGRGETP